VDTTQRLVRASTALQLPIVVTEQYPKAFGVTVSEIADHLPQGTPVLPKTNFSMMVMYFSSTHSQYHYFPIGPGCNLCADSGPDHPERSSCGIRNPCVHTPNVIATGLTVGIYYFLV
jgi:hypothetical protein